MKLKKFLAIMLSLCLVLALCACGSNDATSGDPTTGQSGQQTASDDQQAGTSGQGTVDFGLQTAPDPDFDSPATGDDSGKLYTIVGDYAYELDPATLQPIGEPLDPVTHLPVSNPVLDGENPSTPNNPQNDPTPTTPDPTPTEPDPEPTPAEPTPDPAPQPTQELPNTGMFLEDD